MRFYTVHANPARKELDQRIVLVKEGFAWWAFFTPLLWTFYRRVWIALPLYFLGAAGLFLILFYGGFDPYVMSAATSTLVIGLPVTLVPAPDLALALLSLLFALLCGFEANDLRRFHLKRRGYALVDVVAARNEAEAERSYFTARPAPENLSGSSIPGGGGGGYVRPASLAFQTSEPVTGLFDAADARDNRHP